jgi:transposase
MGYPVRLIHPRFVMPFVKGSKNDAVDAEAIHEAALRPELWPKVGDGVIRRRFEVA